jgi:hypothetical protein
MDGAEPRDATFGGALTLRSLAASALVLVGVTAQVAWAQADFFKTRLPAAQSDIQLTPVTNPRVEFVRHHVPTGQPIIFLTGSTADTDWFSYFQLSYATAPQNTVWWAVIAPQMQKSEDWQDVSAGPEAVRRLAAAKHAHYLVFSGTKVPVGLPAIETWPMDSQCTVVYLND